MTENLIHSPRANPVFVALGIFALSAAVLHANFPFDSGSDGSFGTISVTSDNLAIDLPPDGVLHCTTVQVASGRTLTFNGNASNTPVYLLATGDVTIDGTIDVSGQGGAAGGTSAFPSGGAGGPGGFAGGHGETPGSGGPGDGQGPGGGIGGTVAFYYTSGSGDNAGYGAFSEIPGRVNSGAPYGSPLLIPMVGGSGGGGTTLSGAASYGGGGGGGAILVASSTRIDVSGRIRAEGGQGGPSECSVGSGGAIRVVAPVVTGDGDLDTVKFSGSNYSAGRARIDSYDATGQSITFWGPYSIGANMVVFPPDIPKLEIVELGGQVIDPESETPVLVGLGQAAAAQQDVRVRATNFGDTAQAKVIVIPEFGDTASFDIDIPNPGPGPGEATVTVDVPANVLSHVYVVTR